MAGCRRSRVIAPSALASFCSPQIKLTAPPGMMPPRPPTLTDRRPKPGVYISNPITVGSQFPNVTPFAQRSPSKRKGAEAKRKGGEAENNAAGDWQHVLLIPEGTNQPVI